MTVRSSISSTGEPYASAQAKAGGYSSVMAGFRQGTGLPDWRMDAEELETATFRKQLSLRREGEFTTAAAGATMFDLHYDIGSVPGDGIDSCFQELLGVKRGLCSLHR